jgi:hypothetical protein
MDKIKTTNCDSCGANLPGVEFYHNGTPVLQACKYCAPANFAAQAQADIDAWLNGGDPSHFFGREGSR